MRKYASYLVPAGISALAMALLYLSAVAWGSLALGKVMFYLESPISVTEGMEMMKDMQKEAEKAEEEEGGAQKELGSDGALPALCIWGQEEGVTLENKNLSRAAVANAILLCGNPGLVLDGCQLPAQGDVEGCVLSEEAAWALFGSSQVVGKEVSYGEASYKIRQVVPIQGNVVAFQAGKQQGASAGGQGNGGLAQAQADGGTEVLDRVTAKKQEGLTSRSLAEKLSIQYGLSARLLDLELLRGISGGCMLLVPITICVCFCAFLLHLYRRQEGMLGKAAMVGACMLLAVISFLFLKSQVRIPEDYIPSRWSDFAFWSGLWREKLEALKFLVGMEKAGLDDGWAYGFLKAAGCGFLAEFLLAAGICVQLGAAGKKTKLRFLDG